MTTETSTAAGAYLRWAIFVVLLPLLPIGAHELAIIFDPRSPEPLLSVSELLGDGELLVLATVISAAAIGDLTFGLQRRNWEDWSSRIAIVIAMNLLVVVGSVLLYGLVTLGNAHRVDDVTVIQLNTQMFHSADPTELDRAVQQAEAGSELASVVSLTAFVAAVLCGGLAVRVSQGPFAGKQSRRRPQRAIADGPADADLAAPESDIG